MSFFILKTDPGETQTDLCIFETVTSSKPSELLYDSDVTTSQAQLWTQKRHSNSALDR